MLDDLVYILFLAIVVWLAVRLWDDTGSGGKRSRQPMAA